MLWMRETEAGRFDTPERRAALEARIGEVTPRIGDEAVRGTIIGRISRAGCARLFDDEPRAAAA